jgi:hypothetical protein
MNKVIVVLSVLLLGSVATALMYARDAQRERARADALVERVFELEPVEEVGLMPAQASVHVESAEPAPAAHRINPVTAGVPASQTPSRSKATIKFQGTLHARKQVEHLQLALAAGTPLQDYQIQALITVMDDVHREMRQERTLDPIQLQTKTNEEIIQRAADILFDSQLEVFIPLLQGEPQKMEARR